MALMRSWITAPCTGCKSHCDPIRCEMLDSWLVEEINDANMREKRRIEKSNEKRNNEKRNKEEKR